MCYCVILEILNSFHLIKERRHQLFPRVIVSELHPVNVDVSLFILRTLDLETARYFLLFTIEKKEL